MPPGQPGVHARAICGKRLLAELARCQTSDRSTDVTEFRRLSAISPRPDPLRPGLSAADMQNVDGTNVDLYIPRKW